MTKKKQTAQEKAIQDKKNDALQEMVAAQLTDRRFAPIKYDELEKKVTYVTARNGLYKVTKTPVALYTEELQTFDNPVVGLPAMEAGVELVIPKIPMKHLVQALSFYRDINDKDKTEASLLFFWNHEDKPLPDLPGLSSDGKLVIYCPKQVNSGALSNFTADENVKWLRNNMALLLETHSHNTMNAFFSGTDDANENMTQFYAVWGKVDLDNPAFAFRYVVGDTKLEISPDVLIDWPTVETREIIKTETTYRLQDSENLIALEGDKEKTTVEEEVFIENELVTGPFNDIAYPADWMPQHSKQTYTSYSKRGKKSPYGYGYGKDYGYDDDYYGYNYTKEKKKKNQYGAKATQGDLLDGYDYEGEEWYGGYENPPALSDKFTPTEVASLYQEGVKAETASGKTISPTLKELVIEVVQSLVEKQVEDHALDK